MRTAFAVSHSERKLKIRLFFCLILFAVLVFSVVRSSAESVSTEEPVSGSITFSCPDGSDRMLKIQAEALIVNVGSQIRLIPEITALTEDAPQKSSVVWSSQDESIAAVDQNGKVKGVAPGTVQITCSLKDNPEIQASAGITVKQPVKSIKPESGKITLLIGASASAAQGKVSVTIAPENASDKACAFSSSNEAVVVVDSEGNLQAKKAGNARITITSLEEGSKVKAFCNVSVEKAVSAITMEKSLTIDKKKNYSLKPKIQPKDAAGKKLEYSSSDPSIAAVSSNGVITAVECGTAVITARATDGSDAYAECKITVVQMVRSIKLDRTNLTMDYKSTYDLKTTIVPENATNPNLRWSSSDHSVVTYAYGKLKAVGVGKATITISSTDGSNVKTSINVRVTYTTKSRNTLSNGYPLGGPFELKYTTENDLKSGTVTVHSLTVQKLNNHYLRFAFSYNAPRGYGLSAFSPPNGDFYMLVPKRSTISGEDYVEFEIHEDDFLASSFFTMKFFGRYDDFWVFPSIDNSLKQYLENPSSVPIPAATPRPTQKPAAKQTQKPSSSGSSRSSYMSDSDLKELAIFYFGLYGGNKSSISLTDISTKGDRALVLIVYGGGHTVGVYMDRSTGEFLALKKGR